MNYKSILLLMVMVGHFLTGHASAGGEAPKTYTADICVYGGTAAGVIAAYTAAKCGDTVLLIEPGNWIGGLTTGGLGQTDAGIKDAITGFSRQFYQRVAQKYRQSGEQWTFEPRVASAVMNDFLKEGKIQLLTQTQLAAVTKNGTSITEAHFSRQAAGTAIVVRSKQFIDCTYEGDLMARAGVSYFIGREDNTVYKETLNGFQLPEYHKQSGYHQFPDGISPYKTPGDPQSGLLWGISANQAVAPGTGDKKVQAYNFRICLTDSASNRIPITRPAGYDPSKYELLIRLIEAQPEMRGINHYFIWSKMPNRKTDINNRGGFSTDMIGMNQDWAEAGYAEREGMIRESIAYTKGLLYFMSTDKRVPDTLRNFIRNWGYPKDEYRDFDHFTPQLYVREARRMVGTYVMTEHNCTGEVTVEDGIGLASYGMDSHNCDRIVANGMVKNEGNVEVHVKQPYPIAYRSITPKETECTNLLVPVCLSSSHIAYGSIRMEPVFMVLSQSAAMAASMAIKEEKPVQKIDVQGLKQWLQDDPFLEKGKK
ncbi:FAD-dependent oxidoreductase [Niabella beijingensis]|uniref:FAD-dependent oxidoreductase n=1 Tax=Niabella beijingensis TaxID=2872700 RepID=UPI001CBACBDE|nr:FAD-dependent oxidoreductase [Niabella beijingensis]MBZ4192480.1 FAD-dependent oxidoreductase [Niabella beijingensis]